MVRVWRRAWIVGELRGHGASGQTAPYARINARHNGRSVASGHHNRELTHPHRVHEMADDRVIIMTHWRPGQGEAQVGGKGHRANHRPAPAAHNARNGSGFGNAIAILGEHARRHHGRNARYNATLDLINVDFVNVGGRVVASFKVIEIIESG